MSRWSSDVCKGYTALAPRRIFWHCASWRLSVTCSVASPSDVGRWWDTGAPVSIRVLGDRCVNIFVGNLAFTTTEQDLLQLFEPYGSVDATRIMTDRETGRSRGFGFVEMPDNRAAQMAIDALNGTSLAGRALTVNEARPREPRREPRQPRW
jgi:cold-inducible RNA-binding protein